MQMAEHSDHPHVTVAIATFNRCRLLEETLASLARLPQPHGGWEILVINNNSQDETEAALLRWQKSIPVLKPLLEPLQGLSHARNLAISEARGEILVFLDDDVLLNERWLPEMLKPFTEHEDVWCVGGAVQNVFPDGIPKWMEPQWLRPYCPVSVAGPLPHGSYPMGANMAFRSQVFAKIGGFNPALGRKGKAQLAGEESELIDRLRRLGKKVWFVPEAQIIHQLPGTRMNLAYALRHGYDSARSRVRRRASPENYARVDRLTYASSRILVSLVKLLLYSLASLFLLLLFQVGKAKQMLVSTARALGYLRECPVMLLESLLQ